jgi:hypothetical protein
MSRREFTILPVGIKAIAFEPTLEQGRGPDKRADTSRRGEELAGKQA